MRSCSRLLTTRPGSIRKDALTKVNCYEIKSTLDPQDGRRRLKTSIFRLKALVYQLPHSSKGRRTGFAAAAGVTGLTGATEVKAGAETGALAKVRVMKG